MLLPQQRAWVQDTRMGHPDLTSQPLCRLCWSQTLQTHPQHTGGQVNLAPAQQRAPQVRAGQKGQEGQQHQCTAQAFLPRKGH